ncbi:MAG: protein translocase subunit SecD [Patescibacteria group bacterium]|nr:protein translocase subunit SecD [Patescibacteria group bacterium]
MRRSYTLLLSIVVIALLAGFFVQPQLWDRGINWWNDRVPYPKLPGFHKQPFKLGLDLAGGAHLVYQADVSKIPDADRANALAGLRDVIERRVNRFGVSEPVVQVEQGGGGWRLIVELAGIHDIGAAVQAIGATPYLEFRELRTEPEEVVVDDQGEAVVSTGDPFQATALNGRFLKRAELTFDPNTAQPLVRLVFNEEGTRLFTEITRRNIDKPLAIVIDDTVISAPRVTQEITEGEAVITGIEDVRDARTLTENLQAGALPLPITLIAQQNIGPALGSESLQASLKAAAWGLLLVALFMLFWYRLGGIVAVVTLGVYAVTLLALFKAIPVVLTLSGIAGFILSLGMAVDGNILIFERLREERAAGREFPVALTNAVRRSWPSVRDGQITTLIVALVLFFFGTSLIKGFGLTLALGVVLSIVTAMVVTPQFLRLAERTRLARYRWLWG